MDAKNFGKIATCGLNSNDVVVSSYNYKCPCLNCVGCGDKAESAQCGWRHVLEINPCTNEDMREILCVNCKKNTKVIKENKMSDKKYCIYMQETVVSSGFNNDLQCVCLNCTKQQCERDKCDVAQTRRNASRMMGTNSFGIRSVCNECINASKQRN